MGHWWATIAQRVWFGLQALRMRSWMTQVMASSCTSAALRMAHDGIYWTVWSKALDGHHWLMMINDCKASTSICKRPGFRHFPCPGMVVIDSKWVLEWVLRLDAHVGGQVAVLFEAPFQRFWQVVNRDILVNRDHYDISSSKVIIYPPHRRDWDIEPRAEPSNRLRGERQETHAAWLSERKFHLKPACVFMFQV